MGRLYETVVQDQFGPRAEAYVQSAVHAAGEDLDALEAVARRDAPERAMDIGSGGGHVAYRLAPHATAVTAVDLSAEMLDVVARAPGRTLLRTYRGVEVEYVDPPSRAE